MNEKPSSYRYVIEAMLFLTYALFGVSWLGIAPLGKDLIATFHIQPTDFAYLMTAVTIPKVFAPLVTGALAVRLGLRRGLLIGSLLTCAVIVGPLFPSFESFVVSRFVFGLGGAVWVTLMGPMVMAWFPREELPTANALNGVAVNTGIAVTMYTAVPLAGTSLGWKGTLLVFAAANVLLFVAWALFGRDGQSSAPAKAAAAAPAPEKPVRYMDVWRLKETWIASAAFTGAVALYLSFSTWLPTFYQTAFHFEKAAASQYSGIVNLVGIPSAVVCGLLTKKLGVRRPFLIAGGLVTGTAAFGMFLVNSPAVIMASAVLLGIGLFIPTAAITTLLMELPGVTPKHVSLIMGTMFSLCYTVSAFAPNLVAYLQKLTGSYVPGFAVLSVASWVVFIAGFLLPETGPGGKKAVATAA